MSAGARGTEGLLVALARVKMAATTGSASGGAGEGGAVDPSDVDVAPTLTAAKTEHPFFHYYGLLVHQVRFAAAIAWATPNESRVWWRHLAFTPTTWSLLLRFWPSTLR